jgi:hypothetical protein
VASEKGLVKEAMVKDMAVRFEGHAIVSADGMIADAAGEMPPALRNDVDWVQFQTALDRAAVVVLGRKGHERHPNPGRRRLVLTRKADGLVAGGDNAWMWNPKKLTVEDALQALGISDGVVAVTGGTGTYEVFAPLMTAFALTEVHGLILPGGTPTFSRGHPRVVLAAYGLVPGPAEPLGDGVTLTRWSR